MDRHPEARPLGLTYFNDLDPATFGVEARPVPSGPTGLFPNDSAYQAKFGPKPGYYAVSVQRLRDWDGRCAYFRQFKPIAHAGYSIYVYLVTPEQVRAVQMERAPRHCD